ncbi:MAG: hypothetical protein A3F09_05480 [Chlamydiae bacterium RIFCSPHIGHO2_12_FULL_49_11]|nr:MAG: hypothetical protein A3F09_05480 [Chlamydiae bacterium RIFCSPHIGHO2_12_FULL_49_11]
MIGTGNLTNILLALLGLGFLVFIHELAHFIVARRNKMRIEVFSIGMGKPIFFWHKDGVRWQIGILPFGGFVKIAGDTAEKGVDPRSIPDGFFGKTPWQRLKVALAGPVINIFFALIAFTLIWMYGGRDQAFFEHTKIVGWIDPKSELYEKGIRPGDAISEYDGRPYQGYKSLMYSSVTAGSEVPITGTKIQYLTGIQSPYTYNLAPYPDSYHGTEFQTIGVLSPARLFKFDGFDASGELDAPLYKSGIQKGDYVVWIDGEVIFSLPQIQSIVNRNAALVTVERGGSTILARVPRTYISDLALGVEERQELLDTKHEAKIGGLESTYITLPYELDASLTVKKAVNLVKTPSLLQEEKIAPVQPTGREALDESLLPGDKIVAVYGEPVHLPSELAQKLQERRVLVAVDRPEEHFRFTSVNEDEIFRTKFDWKHLSELVRNLGVRDVHNVGTVHLLKPIVPITLEDFRKVSDRSTLAEKAKRPYELFSRPTYYIFVGSRIADQKVLYNPPPLVVFKELVAETYHTLGSLFRGHLNPKWLSGPVGIMKVMHDRFGLGVKEAVYWLGLISLNLGLINLLPIPMLDGGHIFFSLWEIVTRKRLSPGLIQKITMPFMVLLIGFFLFVTYHDLLRLFK